MANFLITGGAGFIGSSLANELSSDPNNHVVVVDNLLTGHQKNLAERANLVFFKADVNNSEEISAIFKQTKFDFVYHYAAVVGVQRTLNNPIEVLNDIEGIKNILNLAAANKVKRVFYSSSSEVYGESVELPQHEETTPLNSRLPYAIVKNVGEAFLRSYKHEYGLDYTIFRFFNTYGPSQSTSFVISKFLDDAIAGRDICIYGDGLQTRTFCYIDDNVTATINSITSPIALNEVINIGSDREITVLDLAKKIIDLANSKSKIKHLPALEEGDMRRRQPDIIKMEKLLGRPFTTLDQGLLKLIDTRSKQLTN